jgi:hypothetical protein
LDVGVNDNPDHKDSRAADKKEARVQSNPQRVWHGEYSTVASRTEPPEAARGATENLKSMI